MRHTAPLVRVARQLVANPDGRHYGYSLSKNSDVKTGVLYPMLRRLLNAGWVSDTREPETSANGRPARRYYTLTPKGLEALTKIVEAHDLATSLRGKP